MLLILAVGLTALSASMMFVEYGPSPRQGQFVFGLLATLFFGWAASIILRRLFEKETVLRMDDAGVWWRPLSDEVIPWCAMRRAWISQVRGQRFVSIELVEPHRFGCKGRFRYLQPLNRGMGFGDVTLSAQGLDCSFDQLQSAVAKRLRFED